MLLLVKKLWNFEQAEFFSRKTRIRFKSAKKRQNGHIEKFFCMCRLGAHTETTFMVQSSSIP